MFFLICFFLAVLFVKVRGIKFATGTNSVVVFNNSLVVEGVDVAAKIESNEQRIDNLEMKIIREKSVSCTSAPCSVTVDHNCYALIIAHSFLWADYDTAAGFGHCSQQTRLHINGMNIGFSYFEFRTNSGGGCLNNHHLTEVQNVKVGDTISWNILGKSITVYQDAQAGDYDNYVKYTCLF